MGLKGRLLTLVLLAVLPALGIIFFTAASERRTHTRLVQADALTQVESTATRLGQYVEGVRQVLVAVAVLPEVSGDDAAACSRLLGSLLRQYPQYMNFGVVDAAGYHWASVLPFPPGLSAADRTWYRQVVATRELSAGEYQIGRLTGKPSINFAIPLKATDGSLRRILYVALDLRWLNDQLAREPLPEGAILTVFDRDGTVLARTSDGDRMVGQRFPETPLVQRICAVSRGTVEAQGIDGVRRLYAFSVAGGPTKAFHVAVGIPRHVALRHVLARLRMNLAVVLGIALLALAAAWFGGQALVVKPVERLIGATDRLRSGDLGVRVAVAGRKDELARLGQAFNEMAGALQAQIAEREAAVQALRASETMLNETGRIARIGGWELDLDRNTLTWTREVYVIHEVDDGYRPTVETAIGFYAPESRPVIQRAVDRAIRSGEPFDVQLEVITARNRRIWVEAIGRPQVKDGRVRSVSGTFQDITERKRIEDELRRFQAELEQRVRDRTAQLEAANKELESFSYSVSHDLRAPLRAVDGFSHALLEDYGDRLGPEAQDFLNRIRAGTRRMGQLIDDLLKLSRISRAPLQRQVVDLSALATDILGELRAAEPQRQVATQVAEHLVAEADPNLIRIVLDNLLGNAWKFTARTPQARIEFGRSAEGLPGAPGPGSGGAVFFVRDNGAGFDMTYADKLFGAFQRLHRADEFPGTGIGLATVARIIHRHGGDVRAVAEVGKGAAFYFSLESAPAGPAGAALSKEEPT